ncbi:MAG: ABC transporter permease [Propionibacteriaceae bacterium]
MSKTNRSGVQAPWITVMTREMLVKLTDKAFIVTTLVTLLLMVGGIGATAFFGNRAEETTVAVTTTEAEQIVAEWDELVKVGNAKSEVTVVQVADVIAGEQLLEEGKADLLLAPSTGASAWEVVAKENISGSKIATLNQVLSEIATTEVAQKAGIQPSEISRKSHASTRSLKVEGDRGTIAMIMSGVFSVLFLMSALGYGMQIAQSVLEEKQSRIIEILVSAIPVRHLLAGKVLGNTVMALGQMILMSAVGLIGVQFTPMKDILPALGSAVFWYLVLFVAGFLALACLWAAGGALGTRSEDLQYTLQPLSMLIMGCYIAGFIARGAWRVVFSFVPVISTILMPTRMVEGTAHWWEAVIAVVLNVAFAVMTVWVGSRIYRKALLQTNGRLSFRKALKLKV